MIYIDANEYGFLPANSGIDNLKALQKAVDKTGTIHVNKPGEYRIAGTIYIGSNTTLKFGNGVLIKKVNEVGGFSHVILNKGALNKTFNEHIRIENLRLIVNGIDFRVFEVFGLQGHIAFHYVRDLMIEGFRCMDLGASQFAIHICTFEDIIIRDVMIKGDKDGVHLGKGKRFYIGNGVFQTFDDAVALNAQDYDKCNPELGWIEDGVVENCHDLDDDKERKVGFFCRALAGGWRDWFRGMVVQRSDTIVSDGRIYRVKGDPDGTFYTSKERPTHKKGSVTIDGINWVMIQENVVYNAGVRNVIFRNIFLRKPRIGFAVILENNRYNRSYYEGSPAPVQGNISMENIKVLHDKDMPLIEISSPVDYLAINNSYLNNTGIQFYKVAGLDDYLETILHINGCVFNKKSINEVIDNKLSNKVIDMTLNGSIFTG